MSVRTGIARIYNFTIEDAVRVYQVARDAVGAALMFGKWWKTADPFKKYRLVQIPIEIAPFVILFYINTIIVSLRPVLDISTGLTAI